jgi:hypothetical protein
MIMASFHELDRLVPRLQGIERNLLVELMKSKDPALLTAAEQPKFDSRVLELVVGRATDIAFRDWTAIFADMSAQDGKRMAKEGQELLGSVNRSFTYGEVLFSPGSFSHDENEK